MSSCVENQCTGNSQMAVEIKELKEQLKKAQTNLKSTEQMKDLLIEKIKEIKEANIKEEEETISKLSVLLSQKDEMLSMLENQKTIINELMLGETKKIKKLRTQKSLLSESKEAALKKAEDMRAENVNLRQLLANKKQQDNEYLEEMQRLKNEIKEKEDVIKKKEENSQIMESRNKIILQRLKRFKDKSANSDLKIEKMEECLKEQTNNLKQVHEKFESANAENESLQIQIEKLESEINSYKLAAEDKDMKLNELEMKSKEEYQQIKLLADSNTKLLSVTDNLKKVVAEQKDNITKKQREVLHIDEICKQKDNMIEQFINQIEVQNESLETVMNKLSEIQEKKKRKGVFKWLRRKHQAN
eukprot:gene9498-10492_t